MTKATAAPAAKVKFTNENGKVTVLRLPKENLSEEEQIARMAAFVQEEDIQKELNQICDRLIVLMTEWEKCISLRPKFPEKVLNYDPISFTLAIFCQAIAYDAEKKLWRFTSARARSRTNKGVDLIIDSWNASVNWRISEYANGAVFLDDYLSAVIETYPCASGHPRWVESIPD